jgi:enoyl-CoA hydratase
MSTSQPVYETEEPVAYQVRDGVAHVILNRPRYNNAQNGQMTYALDDAFTRAANDEAVGAIVLSGRGKHFSAGHDIGTPGRDVDRGDWPRVTMWPDHVGLKGAASPYTREQEIYLGMCRRWRALPKPMIAAVQGGCIAGGLMLAWICDLIVASEDAFFSDPVLAMGVPGVEYFVHAFELPPRVGRELLFLGKRMTAQRAYQLGMVNEVVARDALENTVHEMARELAAKPGFGMSLAKQAFNAAEDLMGRQHAVDHVFGLHHLAHAHNMMISGQTNGGMDARSMAAQGRGKNGTSTAEPESTPEDS